MHHDGAGVEHGINILDGSHICRPQGRQTLDNARQKTFRPEGHDDTAADCHGVGQMPGDTVGEGVVQRARNDDSGINIGHISDVEAGL